MSIFNIFKKSKKDCPYIYMYDYLSSKSFDEREKAFKKNISNFEYRKFHYKSYKNRELLSEDMKKFFDQYDSVSFGLNFSFERSLILSDSDLGYELGHNLIQVGNHSSGSLLGKTNENFIFYDDMLEEDYTNNCGHLDIYDFILSNFYGDKFGKIKTSDEMKEKLDQEFKWINFL